MEKGTPFEIHAVWTIGHETETNLSKYKETYCDIVASYYYYIEIVAATRVCYTPISKEKRQFKPNNKQRNDQNHRKHFISFCSSLRSDSFNFFVLFFFFILFDSWYFTWFNTHIYLFSVCFSICSDVSGVCIYGLKFIINNGFEWNKSKELSFEFFTISFHRDSRQTGKKTLKIIIEFEMCWKVIRITCFEQSAIFYHSSMSNH